MMKVFDGTSLSSIIRSLSICLNLSPKKLLGEIKYYTSRKIPNLDIGDSPLQDFINQCKTIKAFIDTPTILFDKIIFFHKTSLIDNGEFLRNKGVLHLDELLLKASPLSGYLKTKGVEFFTEDDIFYICINGKSQAIKDINCSRANSSKKRIVERLTERKSIKFEGITGFLFLDDAKNDATYKRISHAPEFLLDINDCISGIANDWQMKSIPAILKCEVDTRYWYRGEDIYEQDDDFKKSYEVAKEGFLSLVEAYAKQYKPDLKFRSSDYYPFVTHGVSLPPSRVKIIYYQS